MFGVQILRVMVDINTNFESQRRRDMGRNGSKCVLFLKQIEKMLVL
jgi:hypothetical protein